MDRRFIRRCPLIPASTQCTNYTDACTDSTVGSSDGVNSLFSCVFDLFLCFFVVVASMGPRYIYKDMLDNVVSPIAHESPKSTRTNGKWDHVRYNIVAL
jgi:hypothetical protein